MQLAFLMGHEKLFLNHQSLCSLNEDWCYYNGYCITNSIIVSVLELDVGQRSVAQCCSCSIGKHKISCMSDYKSQAPQSNTPAVLYQNKCHSFGSSYVLSHGQ